MLSNAPFDTFIHTQLNLLLIIYWAEYCKLWQTNTECHNENRSEPLGLFLFFIFKSYFFLFVLDTFAANQLSDIPFEARQAASVSEMLRLISCHKPNDKTYFLDLLPLSSKRLLLLLLRLALLLLLCLFMA